MKFLTLDIGRLYSDIIANLCELLIMFEGMFVNLSSYAQSLVVSIYNYSVHVCEVVIILIELLVIFAFILIALYKHETEGYDYALVSRYKSLVTLFEKKLHLYL